MNYLWEAKALAAIPLTYLPKGVLSTPKTTKLYTSEIQVLLASELAVRLTSADSMYNRGKGTAASDILIGYQANINSVCFQEYLLEVLNNRVANTILIEDARAAILGGIVHSVTDPTNGVWKDKIVYSGGPTSSTNNPESVENFVNRGAPKTPIGFKGTDGSKYPKCNAFLRSQIEHIAPLNQKRLNTAKQRNTNAAAIARRPLDFLPTMAGVNTRKKRLYRDLIDSLIPKIRDELEKRNVDAKAILAELNTPCFKEFIVMYIRFRRDSEKTLPVDAIVSYLLSGCRGALHSRIREIKEELFATDRKQGILGTPTYMATQEEIDRMTYLIAELTAYITLYYKYYREAPVTQIEAEIDSIYDNDSLMAKYDTFRASVDRFSRRGIPNAGLNAELMRLSKQSKPLPKINANHQRRLTEEQARRRLTGRKVGIRTNAMVPMTYVSPPNAAVPTPQNAAVPTPPNAAPVPKFTPKLNTFYTDGVNYYEFITVGKEPILKQYIIADESVTVTEYAGPIPNLTPVKEIPSELLSYLEKDLGDIITSAQGQIPSTYTLISIDPDGDCLFNAIADQFFGSPDEGAYLRQLAMAAIRVDTYLDDNPDFLIPAPTLANRNPNAIPKNEYIREYSKPGTYGGNVELQQLANMLSCAIVIHYVDEGVFRSFPQIGDGRVISLMFYGEERFPHYDSLRVNTDTYPIFRGSQPPIPPLDDAELATKLDAIKAALSSRAPSSPIPRRRASFEPVHVPPRNAPLRPPTPPPNKPKSLAEQLAEAKAAATVLRTELRTWAKSNPGQSQKFAALLREGTQVRANQQPQINALQMQLSSDNTARIRTLQGEKSALDNKLRNANEATKLSIATRIAEINSTLEADPKYPTQTALDNILGISKGLTNAATTNPMFIKMKELKTLDELIKNLERQARAAKGGYRKRTNKKNRSMHRKTRKSHKSKLRI